MSKKQVYWMAPGVVCIGVKEYGGDTPLPLADIDKRLLEKWAKSGKIGEKIAPVVKDSRDDKIYELENRVNALNIVKEEFDVLKAKVLALNSEAKEVKKLKEEVENHGSENQD